MGMTRGGFWLVLSITALLLLLGTVEAFAPPLGSQKAVIIGSKPEVVLESQIIRIDQLSDEESGGDYCHERSCWMMVAGATPALVALFSSLPAEALATTDGSSSFILFSALAAYVHCASLLIAAISLSVERFTIRPGMTEEENNIITIADTLYGISAVTIIASGYSRITQYGKGWDFYKHEPLFWVKLTLFGVMGAVSLFPTTMIIKRAIQRQTTGSYPPMSEKLAKRFTSLVNTELLALLSIPLFATTMSRGVLYSEAVPWQLEAIPLPIALLGFGYKYVNEALQWKEDEVVVTTEAD